MYQILDSEERTEFESGAVRDMHEGKGRMDLLPWAAIMEVSKHCEAGAKRLPYCGSADRNDGGTDLSGCGKSVQPCA